MLRGSMSNDGKVSDFGGQSRSNGNLLTADEVAIILRVPKSCVYAHLGDLPVIRLGRYVRFKRSDIDEFLSKRATCQ